MAILREVYTAGSLTKSEVVKVMSLERNGMVDSQEVVQLVDELTLKHFLVGAQTTINQIEQSPVKKRDAKRERKEQ